VLRNQPIRPFRPRFEAEDRVGETVTVDRGYVRDRLAGLAKDSDLSRYIL